MLIFLSLFPCGCDSGKKTITNLDLKGASTALDQKYTNMTDMDTNELQVIYGLDVSLAEEYKIKSSILANGNFYAILKVSDENKSKVKEQMKDMFSILEKQSNLYSPQAVNLIKNHLETSVGNYLIYIVSDNNNEYYEIVKGYIN
jgi:hypothetical protein